MSRKIMKPICQSVLSALALMSFPTTASAAEMSETPFMLQNKVTTLANYVEPNFMLLIDDSASMDKPMGAGDNTSRLRTTQNVLHRILDSYGTKFNWGLQTYNNNKANLRGYTKDIEKLKRRIDSISPEGGTPTTRRYYEVTKDMRENTKYRCQKNYIVVLTDGDANTSCWLKNWLKTPTFEYSKNPDPFFGPREPGKCVSVKGSGPVDFGWDRDDGLEFFSKKLAEGDFKTKQKDGNDEAGVSWDGDPSVDPIDKATGKSKYAQQTISTYTIALSNDISGHGEIYLWNGASRRRNGEKNYFEAKKYAELEAAFKRAVEEAEQSNAAVGTETGGTIAPAITGDNKAPNAAMAVHVDSETWSSQIRFYNVNKDDKAGLSFHSDYKQPSFGNRKTLVSVGTGKPGTSSHASGTHFFDSLRLDNGNGFFDIRKNSDGKEWRDALLPWTARSEDDNEIKNLAKTRNYSQPYRVREAGTRDLGDIIDSPITAIGDKTTGRHEFLVTSANDGMVHIFRNNDNPNHPYDLKVSYIPAGMERSTNTAANHTLAKVLKEVAHQEYGKSETNPHRYLLNGGFTVLGTPKTKTGKRHYFMFGAMGQGGRGAYALNVGGYDIANENTPVGIHADSNSWARQVPLFETEKGKNNSLGFTIGTPKIGRIAVAANRGDIRYGGFLASGYKDKPAKDATQDTVNETALYIYDMLGKNAVDGSNIDNAYPGTLIKKMTVQNGIGGLSTPTLLDIESDGIYDLAYAGDYGGNLYRFDLRGGQDAWKVTRIFKGSGSKPIVAAPTISYRPNGKYIIIVGTGSEVYTDDVENTDTQSIYGIFDDVNNLEPSAAVEGNLLVQTFTEKNGLYYLSDEPIQAVHKGWKIDLTDLKGERIVTQGRMLLRTALLETRAYNRRTETNKNQIAGDVCAVEKTQDTITAQSRQLQIRSENGGGVKKGRDAYVVYKDVEVNAEKYFASGKYFDGLVSTSSVAAAISGSPLTLDGEGGASGEDNQILAPNKVKRTPNNCFRSTTNQGIVLGSTNKAPEGLDVEGPRCSQNIRRISWRELI
ncbi:PilC family type IV pilus tip adhesin [Neisseria wadsworthii]|uniref:Neisseria PilC protein n=1 Tax=Neisseria wadsworthii 9715 TaxID=1030841 RepID=G4CTL1_9NEIS|nr:PilC family type IV pilus tip adhesin [Neisseria wadsworthii]EGZ44116.1 neisseria PilC protein [Neisseria wadsworthii 9715]QMT35993.1 VWA domain-containing protein [Neisseria wadsworthii]